MVDNWLIEKYVAHRGFHSGDVKENTLRAFQRAIDNGYNIELDVQLTKDYELVVFHDLHLLRLMGKDCLVRDLTLSELKRIRYRDSDETIPTLDEVLALCAGKTGLMIEVKKDSYESEDIFIEPLLVKKLAGYAGDYILKSFNPFCVAWLLAHTEGVKIGLLSEYEKLEDYGARARAAVSEILFGSGRRADFFDYAFPLIGSPLFLAVHGKMPLIVWTVRSQKQYETVRGIADNIVFEGFLPQRESV